MNIGVYSHYFTPEIGAPSARIYDLAQQWLKLGYQVQVDTCFPNHPTGQLYPGYKRQMYMHEQLDGVNVHRHWTYITPNEGFLKKTLGHISYLPSSLLFSNRHMPSIDITIGSSPTFFAAMAAAYTGWRRRVPFVMEVRDLWPEIFVELGVLRNPTLIRALELLEFALYRQATRIVTVTEAFRQSLIERGVPSSKIFTITNGADIDYWQPMAAPTELQQELGLDNQFVVLYIGAHGISQALSCILETAQKLNAFSQIKFLFVGEGAEKAELIKRAQQLQLNNVQFLDPVNKEKVKKFYALADVCLVPLRNIPLFSTFIPSKMFEIMAMATPVIGSVRGEAAEILQRSGGALVTEPENSSALAEAILDLYEHRGKVDAMGCAGRKFVIENYSRGALATKYIEVLNDAIANYKNR